MSDIQYKIYKLAKTQSLKNFTLRKIAEIIGEKPSPQQIKHHINQLLKKGLLKSDWTAEVPGIDEKTGLINIPIMGSVF